ncbi:hypothetical protein AGR4A_Lc40706 [Agrobacterium tumefaciens str. B6]|uniref:Uncharacterized protein n=1 Tax=Agrobacterium tumefaciens str. B6 TaxID=1183423 RepID=A0A822V9T5_AGRTU|nr:hypothetical protein AGR4A_Lc40706 [Agrobacterium tumefaciens str. B6]
MKCYPDYAIADNPLHRKPVQASFSRVAAASAAMPETDAARLTDIAVALPRNG